MNLAISGISRHNVIGLNGMLLLAPPPFSMCQSVSICVFQCIVLENGLVITLVKKKKGNSEKNIKRILNI